MRLHCLAARATGETSADGAPDPEGARKLLERALLSLPCDPARITSWRMPEAGEDPAEVWAPQYYHRRPTPEEWVPERRV